MQMWINIPAVDMHTTQTIHNYLMYLKTQLCFSLCMLPGNHYFALLWPIQLQLKLKSHTERPDLWNEI
jgi:hypothetical protein